MVIANTVRKSLLMLSRWYIELPVHLKRGKKGNCRIIWLRVEHSSTDLCIWTPVVTSDQDNGTFAYRHSPDTQPQHKHTQCHSLLLPALHWYWAVMLLDTATLRTAGESQVSYYHPHKMAARSAGKGTASPSLKTLFMTYETVCLYKHGEWGARKLTPPYLKSATPLKQVLQQQFMSSVQIFL